jgi:hypothetical protein
MLTIESASSPQFADASGNVILLNVKFKEFEEVLPFHAMPNDSTEYGVELYNRAVAGEFGTVLPYVPPTDQPETQGTQTL